MTICTIPNEKTMAVKTENPHFVGEEPAWDITLSNEVVHKNVTRREIIAALQALLARGLIYAHDAHIDVVRHIHILNYDKFHTS